MVEASKLWFESACGASPCSDLIHPWTDSCVHATATMLGHSVRGAYKFYAAVYLVQILMKGKALSREEWLEQLQQYLKSGVFGFTVGTAFVTLNCLFRHVFFNSFHYYTTVLLPCALSGLSVYLEPPHRRVLVVNLFVNLVFEYWMRTLEMKGYLCTTPARETFVFMLGSSLLFYLMRREKEREKRTPLFWLFSPPGVNKTRCAPRAGCAGRSAACPHAGSCATYVLKGTAKMFGLGCAMSMLRTLVPQLLTPVKALRSVKANQFRLGLFFGGYIGIYRLVTCVLCRRTGRDDPRWALPAGLAAAAAFRLSPSLSISLASVTACLQMILSELYQRGKLPHLPGLLELTYCLCQGLLFHARVMHEDVCPRYILNLMKTVTSNKANEIQARFVEKLLKSR